MSFSYPLTAPISPLPSSITMRPRASVGGTPSPFTLHLQTQVHQGQRWELSAVYPPMSADEAAEWEAFFLKLNGKEGTFLFGDDSRLTAQGSASSAPGTPLVKGANQTGNALVCDGAPFSATNYLKAGDYISLGSGTSTRLYKVLTDTSSDGAGNFTVDIWPKLQVTPSDNAAVTVANCKGLFMLAGNVMQWSVDLNPFYSFTLDAMSVV